MFILKWFFKLLALPFLLALTLLFWAGVFVTSFSAVVFNLLACLCFFMAVAVLLFGLASGAEALRTLRGLLRLSRPCGRPVAIGQNCAAERGRSGLYLFLGKHLYKPSASHHP